MDKDFRFQHYIEREPRKRRLKHVPLLLLLVICSIAAFVPPLVIDALFGIGDKQPLIIVHWAAADALGYFGSISAAVIAITGVIYSVRAAGRSQEDQLRDNAAPYFSAIFLDQQNKHDAFSGLFTKNDLGGATDKASADAGISASEEPPTYQEVETRDIYALLGDKISYKRKLDDDERKHVESDHLIEEIARGTRAVVSNSVLYMPIVMRNVGKGSAVGVRIGVNRKEDTWSGVSSLTLGVGESFYLGVYIDTDKPAVFGDYEIRIAFSDCLGYQYQQSFELHVVKETDPKRPSGESRSQVFISYLGSRKLLSDKERREYLASLTNITHTYS